MARTAADDQADLAVQRTTCPDEARSTLDALNVLRIRRGEALDQVVLELGGVVVEICSATSACVASSLRQPQGAPIHPRSWGAAKNSMT